MLTEHQKLKGFELKELDDHIVQLCLGGLVLETYSSTGVDPEQLKADIEKYEAVWDDGYEWAQEWG